MKTSNKSIKTLLFENMSKLNPDFKINEGIMDEVSPNFAGINYKIKVDKIKLRIDSLIDEGEYDTIDSLYQILRVDKFIKNNKTKKSINIGVNESITKLSNIDKVNLIKTKIDNLFENKNSIIIDELFNKFQLK